MLDGLRGVAGEAALRRLVTFECAAAEVDPARIADPPHLCFIDGEHTTAAVLADYAFCDRVRHADGAVCFHDAGVVWQAVRRIARDARRRRHGDRGAALLVLAGSVAALAFGDSPLRGDPAVEGLRRSPATVLLRSAAGALRRRRAA